MLTMTGPCTHCMPAQASRTCSRRQQLCTSVRNAASFHAHFDKRLPNATVARCCVFLFAPTVVPGS